jgi:hypothetical protein
LGGETVGAKYTGAIKNSDRYHFLEFLSPRRKYFLVFEQKEVLDIWDYDRKSSH